MLKLTFYFKTGEPTYHQNMQQSTNTRVHPSLATDPVITAKVMTEAYSNTGVITVEKHLFNIK